MKQIDEMSIPELSHAIQRKEGDLAECMNTLENWKSDAEEQKAFIYLGILPIAELKTEKAKEAKVTALLCTDQRYLDAYQGILQMKELAAMNRANIDHLKRIFAYKMAQLAHQ